MAPSWRPTPRFDSIAALLSRSSEKPVDLASAGAALGARLHAALAGRPAVIDLGASSGSVIAGPHAGGGAALLRLVADVRVDLRAPASIARSGGAFYASATGDGADARPTIAEWLRGSGAALVFDTRRGSELQRSLRDELRVQVPAELRGFSRSPIATLGRPLAGAEACRSSAAGDSGGGEMTEQAAGLAFHMHERNWLYLASGRKRWYFRTRNDRFEAPATALNRVSEADLRARELATATDEVELFTLDQRPGEVVILPDGVWHCTYNLPPGAAVDAPSAERAEEGDDDGVVVGFGGMGACASDAHFFAAAGDVASLEREAPEAAQVGLLVRAAAEQALPAVLEWCEARFGRAALAEPFDDGATALHVAASSGDAACVEYLIRAGCGVSARDGHGTTPAHWAARSGNPAVLQALRDAGANLEEEDGHCRCRPLHLLAGEGHLGAIRWAVEVAGVDIAARDGNGMRPEDWADAAGHGPAAEWLREARAGKGTVAAAAGAG